MKKVVIVAGDKSADNYCGLLCRHLKERSDQIELYSFAGAQSAACSQQIINLVDHSVTGLVEILCSLPKIFAALDQTAREIRRIKPDLVILCDFPDFNLRLAQKLNHEFPVYYYISPQVWAWRPNRVELIRKYVDKMIVIFQFEEEFYRRHNIPVLYFGHPLLELIPPVTVEQKNLISFMPGSRKSVLKNHLPIIIKAKDFLATKLPGWQFQLVRPPNIAETFYHSFSLNMELVEHSYAAIAASKLVVATSGTSGVELAVLGVPYILFYKMNDLSWWLLKRMVKAPYAGMVNILAGRPVVKELLQKRAMPINVAAEALSLLKSEKAYAHLKTGLAEVKDMLKPEGAAQKFAEYILSSI